MSLWPSVRHRRGSGPQVAQRDDEIDRLYHQVFDDVLTEMRTDPPRSIPNPDPLRRPLPRAYRRPVTNIAEDVVFLATGEVEDLNLRTPWPMPWRRRRRCARLCRRSIPNRLDQLGNAAGLDSVAGSPDFESGNDGGVVVEYGHCNCVDIGFVLPKAVAKPLLRTRASSSRRRSSRTMVCAVYGVNPTFDRRITSRSGLLESRTLPGAVAWSGRFLAAR